MAENRHTILIVDDDIEIVDVLKDHFKQRNCETITTTDPAAVIDKLRNFSIKLMLLDLKMKRLDGFDVLDKIKEAALDLPPTLIMTGHLPKYKDRLEHYGIREEDVVTKPFTFDLIERRINRKLGRQIVSSEVGSEYEDKIYQKNRCRIAFVEDEKDVLDYLAEFFGERHYKISCYKNGSQALEGLKKNPADIVLVDIKLPGLAGDKLMEELKREASPPTMIPISADPLSKEMEARLKSLNCKDFISKPFDVVELIEQIKTLAIEKGLLG